MQPSIKTSFTAVLTGLALSACLFSSTLRAEIKPIETASDDSKSSRFAIGAGIGTSGYGPFVILSASKNFTATVGYTLLDYDRDVSTDDGNYKGKLKLSNVQAILNWHPFSGTFHLSAGAFLGNNKVTAVGQPKPNDSFKVNGVDYTAAQVGTLHGEAELAKGTVPYVGLGWSKKALKSGFGCFFDVGVMIGSEPMTKLSATGPIASDATFQANLRQEEADMNEELKTLRYYPVIQFGVLYRF